MEHSEPTHPHQLSPPDAVPISVSETQEPTDSQPIYFNEVAREMFMCFCFLVVIVGGVSFF